MNRVLTGRRRLAAAVIVAMAGVATPCEADEPQLAAAPEAVAITPELTLAMGGVLVYQKVDTEVRYLISYLYENTVWAARLMKDDTRMSPTAVQFSRWQLNQGWRYLPPGVIGVVPIMEKPSPVPRRQQAVADEAPAVTHTAALYGSRPFAQVGRALYLASPQSHTVAAVDLTTGQTDPSRFPAGLFYEPANLQRPVAILEANNTLYVAGHQSHTVVAIDLATGQRDPGQFTDGVFRDETALRAPSAMIQIGNTLYVAGDQSHTIVAIDLGGGQPDPTQFSQGVFKEEAVLQGPTMLAQVGTTLYVPGSVSHTVVAIDLATGQLDRTKFTQGVFRDEANLRRPVAVLQVGNTLYVAGNQSHTVVAIDLGTGRLDPTQFTQGTYHDEARLRQPDVFVQVGNTLYVAGSQTNTFIAIDLTTGAIEDGGDFTLLPVSDALRQHPELRDRVPAGTRAVAILRSVRIHRSVAAEDVVAKLFEQPWKYPALQDVTPQGLTGIAPYAIIVVDSARDAVPSPEALSLAVIDVARAPLESLSDLLRLAISQWARQSIARVHGVDRLKDRRLAVYVT